METPFKSTTSKVKLLSISKKIHFVVYRFRDRTTVNPDKHLSINTVRE